GGAALTRKYVEDDLRREYSNAVFYSDDAFGGLHIMEDLASPDGKKETRLEEGRKVKEYAKAVAVDEESGPVFAERSPVVGDAPNIPVPPFWGVRVKKDYDLRELFPYINETALFKNQWQLKTASQEDYARLVEQKFRPIRKSWKTKSSRGDGLNQKWSGDISRRRATGMMWWCMRSRLLTAGARTPVPPAN